MAATRLRIFIGSVQNEFAQIRHDLKAFLLGDAALRRFVAEVFLFEDLPAKDRRADDVYLEEVARCNIYLGIFGNDYGFEDEHGVSPTEHEFNRASELGKTRLIYVWGTSDRKRHPKMRRLVDKASSKLIRRRVDDVSALTAEVYASLIEHLDAVGALRVPPFDTSVADKATIASLSRERIDWFVKTARRARGFPLKASGSTEALLTHLNLVERKKPNNAAILLFGGEPQRFHIGAQIKCVSCHGIEYRRPFASMQVYRGDLFAQVDQASEFVLGKINRAVGTRASSNVAPRTYELPPDAISEAIVNAVAHRDYHSNASVEVRLFLDRLEVWNPGSLPGTLTLDDLREAHPSVPNNPLIAEALYLAAYIERAGSGTLRMIELCRESGLPEPEFVVKAGSFVVTLWRDWLSAKTVADLLLNERQTRAVAYLKEHQALTNATYQSEFVASKRTASRDLDGMVSKGVLDRVGSTGKGVHYRLRKGVIKGPKGP